MTDRRNFIKQLSSAGLITCLPDFLLPDKVNFKAIPAGDKTDKLWGCLLHLSTNMWLDYMPKDKPDTGFDPVLRFDEEVWNASINKMVEQGLNLVVIDVGDGVLYESHPEISVGQCMVQTKNS